MKTTFIFLALCLSAQVHAQDITVPVSVTKAMAAVDTQKIRAHIAYLADDKLKGRLPGTEGYQMAADYVVEQFRQMGIAPGGTGGSYFQPLTIRKATLNSKESRLVLKDGLGNTDTLSSRSGFSIIPNPLLAEVSVEAPLVFAGYGVDIPGGYSDYTGMDVKGKIVVVLRTAPPGLSSTLTAHYSNVGNKIATAAEKGAAGIIIAVTSGTSPINPNGEPVLNVAMNPEKTIAYGRGSTGRLPLAMYTTAAGLQSLFLQSGHAFNEVFKNLAEGKPQSFPLPVSLSARYTCRYQDMESMNVVGLIPGSDKNLKNEYVVHSAHLDHLGVGKPMNGDSIFNGAHDNASGVASLLEIARIYATGKAKPKRSVLILMVTGEEMGLIGSSYFAANPTVPMSSIVADVNTDMPTVIAPLLSIVPLGADHSSLMKNVEFAARYMKLDIEQDPEPSENRFVRSDQYSFVMNGIPALHIKYGNKTNIPGFDLTAFVKDWRAKYYHHQPDGIDGIFNFTAAKTYVQLNFLISYSIAQTMARPAWNAGDLFGTVK